MNRPDLLGELDRIARSEIELTHAGRHANRYGHAVLKDIVGRFVADKREVPMAIVISDALQRSRKAVSHGLVMRIARVLRDLGWRRSYRRAGSKRYWAYVRLEPLEPPHPSIAPKLGAKDVRL